MMPPGRSSGSITLFRNHFRPQRALDFAVKLTPREEVTPLAVTGGACMRIPYSRLLDCRPRVPTGFRCRLLLVTPICA